MRRSLAALTLLAAAMGSHAAFGQTPFNQTPLGSRHRKVPLHSAMLSLG